MSTHRSLLPHSDVATFVRVWQTSKSVAHAAEQLGLSRRAASDKARYLRNKGIPLRKLRSNWHREKMADFSELAELAISLAGPRSNAPDASQEQES